MDPLVSAVITTYNNGAYIAEALESVLSQELEGGMEIIVVDDGSTDGTEKAVAPYLKKSGPRPVRYIWRENGGPAASRNRGIREARGKYVAMLDGDDVWLPGKLKKSVAFMESRPDVGLLFTDMQEFDENGVFSKSFFLTRRCGGELRRDWERIKEPVRLTLRECVILPSTTLIRAGVFKATGLFDESLRNGEDMDLFLRISLAHPVACLPEVLVSKRGHATNISGNRTKVMRAIIHVLDRMKASHPDLMRKHRGLVEAQLADVHAEAGYQLFAAREFSQALPHLALALRHGGGLKNLYYAGISLFGAAVGRRAFERMRSMKGVLALF